MLVNISKEFTLAREDGTSEKFYPGPQNVTEEDAAHWYLRAHLKDAPSGERRMGTWEYQQQKQTEEKQRIKEALEEQELRDAAERERQEAHIKQTVQNANKSIHANAKSAIRRERLKLKVG